MGKGEIWKTTEPFRNWCVENWGAKVAYLIAIPIALWILSRLQYDRLSVSLNRMKDGFGLSDAAFYADFWAVVGCVLLIVLAALVARSLEKDRLGEFGFLLVLASSGAALGGILGTYLSPQNVSEKDAFGGFKTAIAGVLSGYLLSKFQKIFDKWVDDANMFNRYLLIRSLLFISPLVLVASAVYSSREYKNQSISIATSRELRDSLASGTNLSSQRGAAINLDPGEQTRFVAEANFPGDTSVAWTTDEISQTKDPQNAEKTVPAIAVSIAADGSFSAPVGVACSPCFVIVATSNQNKEKTARRPVNIGQTKSELQANQAPGNAGNSPKSAKAAPPKSK